MADCPICKSAEHKLTCPNRDGGQLRLSGASRAAEAPRLADRLADALQAHIDGPDRLEAQDAIAIRDELRRLHAEVERLNEELARLREHLGEGDRHE